MHRNMARAAVTRPPNGARASTLDVRRAQPAHWYTPGTFSMTPSCPAMSRSVSRLRASGNPYDALEQVKANVSAFPDCNFFTVQAIIRPWRLPQVVQALGEAGIRGMTVTSVKGLGAQGGSFSVERDAGNECILGSLVEKSKVEIVICKDQIDFVVRLICTTCYTGSVGDGKIFVSPVADVIRIRTGETGAVAERMADGLQDKGYASV
jgi:nitrogen regulatory protein PII